MSTRPDHVASPRRPGRQHAVVQEQVDAGPRRDDRQALQKLHGLEHDVRRAIRPRMPQAQHGLTVACHPQAFLGDGRSQRVSAQASEAVPVSGRRDDPSVQVEPSVVGVAGLDAPVPGVAVVQRLTPSTDPCSHARPRRGAAQNGSPRHRRQRRGLLRPRIRREAVFVHPVAPAVEQVLDPVLDARDDATDVVI